MDFQRLLIQTADGSHTLYVQELNEPYHSVHGAIQESNHVFLKSGFEEVIRTKNHIHILEMGFGTGLNAFLTAIEAEKKQIHVNYTGVEAYPVEQEFTSKINYASQVEDGKHDALFQNLHAAPWGTETEITQNFHLTKIHKPFHEFQSPDRFDLVYFDAFAPEVQPELWTEDIFKQIESMMQPGALLVTYCCKGQVKRNMKAAGLTIEKIPGPPGKREMLRAGKGG